jgi:Xaa-Pro aminopeptidase
VNAQTHAARRARVSERIGPHAALVLPAAPERTRSNDTHYRYRPDSDLYYLTGFAEPGAVLVLRPGHATPLVLFVRPKDRDLETWNGPRAGVPGAVESFGADAAFPIAELGKELPKLLDGVTDLYYTVGRDLDFDPEIQRALAQLRAGERRGSRAPERLCDGRAMVAELRMCKEPGELDHLRRALAITDEAHRAAMRASRAGTHEYELEALVDYTFRRRGGTGPGYGTIVASGANATILHWVQNDGRLEDGQLVLVDAGCELDYYTADVTRTWPVGGRFTPAARALYDVVLDVQERAVAMVRPGITVDDIHRATVEWLVDGARSLGLLSGDTETILREETYRRVYMHRTNHWLGLDVHDVGAYNPGGTARPLGPGMVITVEPGLYVAADDVDSPAEYRGLGVRIEDDVLVTATGHEVLTAAIPKRPDDLISACS